MLKDDGISSRFLKGSLTTSSKTSFEVENEKSILVVSFERTPTMDEQSSRGSRTNGETSSRRVYKEEKKATSNGIFEIRNACELSTSNIIEDSTIEKYWRINLWYNIHPTKKMNLFAWRSQMKKDNWKVTPLSYKKLFKLNAKLIHEHDTI